MEWESEYSYEPRPQFEQVFTCLPFSKYKNSKLQEIGNKIIMPQSSLAHIVSARIPYPLFFKIRNFRNDDVSHCGVLEFDADEGFVHFPEWMMKNLMIEEGDHVILSNAALSKGGLMKLQPHAAVYYEVSDARAVLERTLRDFTCLSKGDTFGVKYNGRDFYFDVLKVSPGDAVSLIDTDCMVDFAPALDYKEEEIVKKKLDDKKIMKKVDEKKELGEKKFQAFTGKSQRLDGEEAAKSEAVSTAIAMEELREDVINKRKKDGGKEQGEKDQKFKAFCGKSRVLGSIWF